MFVHDPALNGLNLLGTLQQSLHPINYQIPSDILHNSKSPSLGGGEITHLDVVIIYEPNMISRSGFALIYKSWPVYFKSHIHNVTRVDDK